MKFLASVLALVLMAACLVLPLDALAGGSSRDFCGSRGGRGFDDGDVVIRVENNSRGRGRGFGNRGSRNDRGNQVRVIVR